MNDRMWILRSNHERNERTDRPLYWHVVDQWVDRPYASQFDTDKKNKYGEQSDGTWEAVNE